MFDSIYNYIDTLIWVDWFFIVLIILSTLLAARKGFLQQILSLVVLVFSFYIALTYNKDIAKALNESIGESTVTDDMALLGIFVVLFYILSKLLKRITKRINKHGVRKPDRLLAIVFGFARGVLFAVIIIAANIFSLFVDEASWKNTNIVKLLNPVTQYFLNLVPDQYEKIVDEQLKNLDNSDTMQTVKKSFNKSFDLDLKVKKDDTDVINTPEQKQKNRIFEEESKLKRNSSSSSSEHDNFLRQQAIKLLQNKQAESANQQNKRIPNQ